MDVWVVCRVREAGRTLEVNQADGRSRTREIGRCAVASSGKPTMSGPKGFALVLGGMLGVMLALWILAALVAP